MGHFSNKYLDLIGRHEGVKEPEVKGPDGVSKKITEEIVRCLWFGRHFDTTKLYTEDGARLEVISPGWWNVEGGPDHLRAEIVLEGKGLVKGDVEIHVLASDWARHAHDRQEEYKDICLHVVMWNDINEGFVKGCTGTAIPQLELAKYVTNPLEELPDVIEGYEVYPLRFLPGPCQALLSPTGATDGQEVLSKKPGAFDRLEHILDQAGDHRILAKAERFQRFLEAKSYESILYEALMESMGYKNNVLQFARLASLVTLEDLRRLVPIDVVAEIRCLWIQAILLGAGGILSRWQAQGRDNVYDQPTREYVGAIFEFWEEAKEKWGKESMESDTWHWAGTRPLNQPPRRIAAMSHLLTRGLEQGVFRDLLVIFEGAKRKTVKASAMAAKAKDYFSALADGFWLHYLTPGGKRLKTPVRLIGEERAAAIFINVILPLFLVYARKNKDSDLEAVLHEAYCGYPRLSPDSILRFMSQRVLPKEKATRLVNSARRQQGLHQIFRDFCQRKDVGCQRCGLFVAIKG